MARILVVDDEPINVKMLSRLLTREGYEVVEASSGQEALDRTAETRPDMILLDVMMPGMDGFEVCSRLKSDEKTRLIPVVMITALDTLEDKVRGIDSGADDFLTKPYNNIELLARCRSLIKMKSLNDDLAQAYANINRLNNHTDQLFATFNPLTFDLEDSLSQLIDRLLRRDETDLEKPEAIFMAIAPEGTEVEGRVFRRSAQGAVVPDPFPVRISLDETGNLDRDGVEVAFSNWDDKSDSIEEYQESFGRETAERVGIIYNYIAYRYYGLAIIAFNYGKKVGPHDAQVMKAMAAYSNFLKTVANQAREVEAAFLYTIEALARAAEALDEETGNHIIRVNSYSRLLAEGLGLTSDFINQVHYSAQMHDVGKIHIPADILRKPGKLTVDEWEVMKTHPSMGAQILGYHPRLEMARRIALHHHERFDGTGYPNKLGGEEISIEGRIVLMADIYDALRSPRSYKPPFTHERARKIILEGDGRVMPSFFDPRVLEVFNQKQEFFNQAYNELADESDLEEI